MVKGTGLVNCIEYFKKRLSALPDNVVAGLTTFCFDISMLEIFLPLVRGATLLLVSSITQKNPVRIIDLLNGGMVSIFQATPTTYEMMISCGWHGDAKVRFLVGGEACRPKVAALASNCKVLINVYGPTETTIWTSKYEIPPKWAPDMGGISIGSPMTNVSVLPDQRSCGSVGR
jgi:non-ribosomal peptide synthetase component F